MIGSVAPLVEHIAAEYMANIQSATIDNLRNPSITGNLTNHTLPNGPTPRQPPHLSNAPLHAQTIRLPYREKPTRLKFGISRDMLEPQLEAQTLGRRRYEFIGAIRDALVVNSIQ